MKTTESILLFNFSDKEKERKVKGVLIQMGIRIKTADITKQNETVGFLLGVKGIESTENTETDVESEPLPNELLVMKGFTDKSLNLFLAQMKKAGIPKIPYKAILTPTNQAWTLKQLYQELEREHFTLNEKESK